MIFWLFFGLTAALMVVGLAAKPGANLRKKAPPPAPPEPGEDALDLLSRDAPKALARYGTPEIAQMLEEQGREELRGLGYRGGKE